MPDLLAHEAALSAWLLDLARDAEVLVPRPRGDNSFVFEPLTDGAPAQLWPYRPTILPPVKALLPTDDPLLSFSRPKAGVPLTIVPVQDTTRRVLAGVRGCDVRGIALLDMVMSDGIPDPSYTTRRAHADIVAVTCLQPCDDRCFCDAVGSLDSREGADVELTPINGHGILVRSLTDRGADLVARGDFDTCDNADELRAEAVGTRPAIFGRQLPKDLSHDPVSVHLPTKHELWARHTERCFSCGTCNYVCPTCYCFDVRDELELTADTGTRRRDWDACMNPAFAEVSGGHNFRASAAARQQHRTHRKFKYLNERFDQGPFCTGCGRCGRQCTANIDIFDIVTDLCNVEESS